MLLLSVKGANFQGYKSFDVTLSPGPLCIEGANMSGKSTFARAVLWCLSGTFPYPNIRFTKDMVRPGNEPVAKGEGTKNLKKKPSRDDPPTIVQVRLSVPHFSPEGSPAVAEEEEAAQQVWIVTRTEGASDKGQLILQREDGAYSFEGDLAQDIILNLAKIPTIGSTKDRLNLFERFLWLGVGQATSFFFAKGTERKKIIESINPFTVLPRLAEESGRDLKQLNADLLALKESAFEQVGALRSKREELARKLSIFRPEPSPEEASNAARRLLESTLFKEVRSLQKIEEESTRLNRELSGLASAEATHSRLLTLQASYEQLSSELRTVGGLLAAEQLEFEARGFLEMMNDAKQLLSQVGDQRTREQAAANEISKKRQRQEEVARKISELDALATDITNKISLVEAMLLALGEPLVARSQNGDNAFSAAAALDTTLPRTLGVVRPIPAAGQAPEALSAAPLVAAFLDKKKQLQLLQGEGKAAQHEARSEQLLASVGGVKTQLAELASAANTLVALDGSRKNIFEKKSLLEQQLKDLTQLQEETSRLLQLARLFAGADTAPEAAKENSKQPVALRLDSAAVQRHLASFDAYLRKVAGDSSEEVLQAFFEQKMSQIEEKSLQREKESQALEQSLSQLLASRDLASSLTQQQRSQKELLLSYERALKEAQAAEQSGNRALCQECGSELSRDHIEKHIEPLRAELKDLAEKNAQIQKEILQLVEGEKERRQAIKGAETDLHAAEAAAAALLEACQAFLQQTAGAGSASSADGSDSSSLALQVIEQDKASRQKMLTELELALKQNEENLLRVRQERSQLAGALAITLGVAAPADDSTSPQSEQASRAFIKSLSDQVASLEASCRREAEGEKKAAQQLRSQAASLEATIAAALSSCQGFLSAAGYQGSGEAVLLSQLVLQRSQLLSEYDTAEAAIDREEQALRQMSLQISEQLANLSSDLQLEATLDYQELRNTVASIDQEAKKEAESANKKASEIKLLSSRCEQAKASLEATLAAVPQSLRGLSPLQLAERRSSLEEKLSETARGRDVARQASDVRRLFEEVERMERNQALYEEQLEDLTDEVASAQVIKDLLAPNGETRTLALAPDVAAIVYTTNQDLAQLNLDKSLAIDLQLEKGEDAQPAVEIKFEVDGSNSGRILPSESQRKIVGLITDLAVRKLRAVEGLLFIDEPETGLDDVNKGKISSFLKTICQQPILLTNSAAAGFEKKLSTAEIRKSAGRELTIDDFGVVLKSKGSRKKNYGGKKEAAVVEEDDAPLLEDAGTL